MICVLYYCFSLLCLSTEHFLYLIPALIHVSVAGPATASCFLADLAHIWKSGFVTLGLGFLFGCLHGSSLYPGFRISLRVTVLSLLITYSLSLNTCYRGQWTLYWVHSSMCPRESWLISTFLLPQFLKSEMIIKNCRSLSSSILPPHPPNCLFLFLAIIPDSASSSFFAMTPIASATS